MGRVARATLGKYAKAVISYVKFINKHEYFQTVQEMEGAVGMFLPEVPDSKLRILSGGMKHFFPFVGKTRISADLKGLERINERRPRTPASRRISRAFTRFVWEQTSFSEGTGVQTMFDAKLRTCEALKVRGSDIIFRTNRIKNTTIRLGRTKNGREQAAILDPDCLAEKMLRVLVRASRDRRAPLFNFRSYARVHKLCCQFKQRFNLTIDFTPHSLRAGSATDDKLCGMTLGEIQFRGRWESVATAKGYVDVVFAVLPETLEQEDKVPEYDDSDFV